MNIYPDQESWDQFNRNMSSIFDIEYTPKEKPIEIIDKMPFYEAGCRKGIGGAPKGRIPWNKGLKGAQKMTTETKQKMSESHKGKQTWNKGLTLSQEYKDKISKSVSDARKRKFWSSKKINP